MIDLTLLSEAELQTLSDQADVQIRRITVERKRRVHAKQAVCAHTGWHTGLVCCSLCGAEDGC